MGVLSGGGGAAGGAGEIIPVFKYNAVNGMAFRVERTASNVGWISEDVPVPFPVRFLLDFDNMEVGQMAFIGNRPDFHLVRLRDVESGAARIPERPTAEHRLGFRVRIWSPDLGLREWRAQAKCIRTVIDALNDEFLANEDRKVGQVAKVELSGATPQKRGGEYPGTDMVPALKIVGFSDRPEEFRAAPPPAPVMASAPTSAPAPAAHVPPPPPVAPPVVASTVGAAEF